MRAVMNHQKGKVETASRRDEDRDLCEVFSSLFAEYGTWISNYIYTVETKLMNTIN